MTINKLGAKLYEMYENAAPGEKVTKVLLFGILYTDDIKKYSIKEIIKQAGIPSNYSTELLKSIKLSRYVEIKSEFLRLRIESIVPEK